MNKQLFDTQYTTQTSYNMPRQQQTVFVVVAKPTRVCNADCSYCSSPPLEEMGSSWEPEWNLEKFKNYFNKTYPYMIDGAYWIWHGGEPMLMGAKFYKECYDYAKEIMDREGRTIHFSMQSNMLGYNEKWYDVFANIFEGSVSTSFDPDENNRTVKGNADTYSRLFKKSLNKILDDGFRPMVIGVYSEETAHLMHKMYDWSLEKKEKGFPLRFNYCHPSGRIESEGEAIAPETYAKYLIELYNRWIKDVPDFTITPLDQMMKKVMGMDGEGHCPWTKKCGGRFIEIEPNGEVYNCSEFADIGQKYCFGNLNDINSSIEQMLNTKPALMIKRRSVQVPISCQTCEHFEQCEGGCMRDAMLYKNGLYGKFHYCKSWKMVFTRIKESIIMGQADGIIKKYGLDPQRIKNKLKMEITDYFNFDHNEIKSIELNGATNKYGFGDNFNLSKPNSNYSLKGEYLLVDSLDTNAFDLFPDPEINLKTDKINQKLSKIKLILEK